MKKCILLTLLVLFGTFLSGCGDDGAKETASGPIVLRLNTQAPSFDTDGNRLHQTFMDEVAKNSNGALTIQPYFGSSLGGTPEAAIGGIQNKSYEMISFALGIYAMYTNAFLPMDVPYLINSDQMAFDLVTGELGKEMALKCEQDTGIKILYYNMLGFRLISNSRHPIASVDDLRGLKIRTQANPFHMATISAYGAAVATTPFSELFTALQQKVVDGQENPITNVRDMKFNEVQRYLTRTNHLYTFAAMGINAEFYNSLPAEQQAAIDKAAALAQSLTLKEILESENTAYQQIGTSMEVVTLTPEQMAQFKAATQPLLAKFKADLKSDYFTGIVEKMEAMAQ